MIRLHAGHGILRAGCTNWADWISQEERRFISRPAPLLSRTRSCSARGVATVTYMAFHIARIMSPMWSLEPFSCGSGGLASTAAPRWVPTCALSRPASSLISRHRLADSPGSSWTIELIRNGQRLVSARALLQDWSPSRLRPVLCPSGLPSSLVLLVPHVAISQRS